jgi:cell division initiation protein
MKVTPQEIRQQQFPVRLRGFDPAAVDAFLEMVASTLEELVKENNQLRQALAGKEGEIRTLRAQEGDWQKVLVAVQQTAEELIARGEQQAQQLVVEAEFKAQQMLMKAEKRRAAIMQDVQALARRKYQLVSQMHSFLEQHLELLAAQEQSCEEKQSAVMPRPSSNASEASQAVVSPTMERRPNYCEQVVSEGDRV